jgi:hypothetical protein
MSWLENLVRRKESVEKLAEDQAAALRVETDNYRDELNAEYEQLRPTMTRLWLLTEACRAGLRIQRTDANSSNHTVLGILVTGDSMVRSFGKYLVGAGGTVERSLEKLR